MNPIFKVSGVSKQAEAIQADKTGRDAAIDELKTQYKTIVKQSEKGKLSSGITVDVARKNFEVTRELKNDKIQDLQGKTSFFGKIGAKITLYLAKHKIYVGELRTIDKLHKKFDSVIGLARKEVMQELKDEGLYLDARSKKGQRKVVDDLIALAQKNPPDINIVALLPTRGSEQYLSYLSISTNIFGEIQASEGVVRYLGRDEDNEPKFMVRGKYSTETVVTGIEDLKSYIAFGREYEEGDNDVIATSKEAKVLGLLKNIQKPGNNSKKDDSSEAS